MNDHVKKFDRLYASLFLLCALALTTYRLSNPGVGFVYYEPTYLPPHISIKAKRISITRGNISVEQNFRTEDWVYSIAESRVNRSIGSANQDYRPESIKPTCSIRATQAGTQYRACHWIDYGRINVHEIKFVKGRTFIDAQIPTTVNQEINLQQLDTFVDSFTKKSTRGFPVLRSNGP